MRTRYASIMTLCAVMLSLCSFTLLVAQETEPPKAEENVTENSAPEESVPEETPTEPETEEQSTPSVDTDESEGTDELDTGDNAWMLTSSALVLFMTVPGLAMFYGGLVRRKNILSVIMQCLFLMGIMTVVWALWGYSLAFGGDGVSNPIIGNWDYLFMQGVQSEWDGSKTVTPMSGTIPMYTHMVFQGMFFIITPALICGAFAERMKFSSMVMLSVLWGTFVYCPLCHWVWDSGFLTHGEGGLMGGAMDFAGGTVVHISSGVSALVCALILGNRLGFGHDDMRPHNLTYTALGAGMLWVGWFGFNAGSAGAANELAANAFVVTHFSAAAGAVAWSLMEYFTRGKASVLGCASGAVAGLVCITPAAGHVLPMPALVMGTLAGIVCFYACTTLKSKFGYDDSLDAFGVHGVGGTLGAILTGVFASQALNGEKLGLLEGGGFGLVIGQIAAVLVTAVFSVIMTVILLKIIDATIGLRVSQEDEIRGLDGSEHGEEGYIFN